MKTKFILLLLLTHLSALIAQTEKGKIHIGGNLYASFKRSTWITENIETKTNNYKLSASPYAGYFLCNNLSLALNPIAKISTSSSNNTNQTARNTSYGFNLSLNKFFGVKKVRPLVGLSAGPEYHFYTIRNSSTKDKDNSLSLSTSVYSGFAYFINNYVSINILLRYSYIDKYRGTSNLLNYERHGITLGSGFAIYL